MVCSETLVDEEKFRCSSGTEKQWLSRAAVRTFVKAAEPGRKMPLRALRLAVETSLGTAREGVNRGVPTAGGRVDTLCPGAALRLAAKGLTSSLGSAAVAAAAVAAYVDTEVRQANVAAAEGGPPPGGKGTGGPRDRGKAGKGRANPSEADKEKTKKARLDKEKQLKDRKAMEVTDDSGRVWKAVKGGNEDCPIACTNRNHQKGTWCAKSHKEF